MAVDDRGSEVLKKAGEEVVPGSKADYYIKTSLSGGMKVNPLAKYLEMVETSATVETYKYYESSSKVTLYNTIVVTYTTSQKIVLSSVEWS